MPHNTVLRIFEVTLILKQQRKNFINNLLQNNRRKAGKSQQENRVQVHTKTLTNKQVKQIYRRKQ